MKCLICGNDDERFMFKHKQRSVCRKCIEFQEGLKENDTPSYKENIDAEYTLSFSLSEKQVELSSKLRKYVLEGNDVLVYAACGAGKTEIVLELIKETLQANRKIGIAVPRRQVVLQLQERLSQYFNHLDVIAVCEGYTEEVYADLIICTTHQLFRYNQYFDVLIIDEPDAFPFANNPLLERLMIRSVKHHVVYLSATPSEAMKEMKTISLFRRFHNHDLIVPKVIVKFSGVLQLKMIRFLKNTNRVMLFVPTIALATLYSKLLKAPCIHSKIKDKESVIKAFDEGKFNILICTTIMERGVTFENVNVCVLYADHQVFTKASLIQIAGRVGRSVDYPTGSGIFLCRKQSRKVEACIQELEMMNA